jgi:hypothetical protein
MSDSFAFQLRAEIDAVVGRYEALVRALAEVRAHEADALRAEVARLTAEADRLRAEGAAQAAEVQRLSALSAEQQARIAGLEGELSRAKERAGELAKAAEEAQATSQAYEEQFAAEKRFVDACAPLAGSLMVEVIEAVLGRAVDGTSATFAVLKARGLEATLVAAFKDRGRGTAQAPLLEREKGALAALAAAAGCELIAPAAGTRFSPSSMEKGGTVSDPAEEGNVVSTAMPGLRRAGTEGALVFPRVVVATG